MVSEKDRLLKRLFDQPGSELVAISFTRGSAQHLTETQFCREIHRVLDSLETGVETTTDFPGDAEIVKTDLRDLVHRLG